MVRGPSLSAPGLTIVAALRLEALAVGGAVVRCGMGPDRAAACGTALASRLLAGSPVAVVGVCGGLDPVLRPGDLVSVDAVGFPGESAMQLPHGAKLAAALVARGIDVRRGRAVSVARMARGAERPALAAAGAVVVDMESAYLVRALVGHPVVVLRTVADTPGTGAVRGGLRALAALRQVRPALVDWAEAVQ